MENKEKEFVKNGRHNHTQPENYVAPTEPAVQEHLKWFMGLKFGLMVHLLLDVVSKGGNLALNLSPQPNGD